MENTRVPVLTLLLFALVKGCWCLDVTIVKNPVKTGDDVVFEINLPSVPESGSWNSQTMLAFWLGSKVISGVGYKGRVSVNTSTGSLTLMSVRLSDSGNYFVQVQTPDGTELSGNATLTVFDPVSLPTVCSNVTNPVEFNDSFSLTCTASGSAVSYQWLNGSSVLSDSERIHLSDDNRTLTIPRVLRSDDAILHCYAFNAVSNSSSEPFHLNVSYGPDGMSITPPEPIYSSVGSDLILSCSAQSSPPAHYHWFFNGAPLNKLGSQLNMANIQQDQTGNYTCFASNNITLRYDNVTSSITVIEPITNVTLNPTPEQPILNNPFNLTCEVSGLGSADSRLWMMDGQPLSTDNRITLSVDNSTVSFNPALLSDNGTYQCTASNLVSSKTGAEYKLIVNYGPEEASIMAPDLVANGSSIMLTCSAHSQPPSDYTWYLNGQQIANSSEYKIDPVNSDNQGNYICVAWNFVTGRDSSAIKELTVIELITEVSVNRAPAHPILNDNLSLTCAVSGTVDSRYWLKDGQPLSTDDRITLSGDNSTVSFNPVLLTDNGTYQCTTNNPLSNKTSDGYILVVNYGPEEASIMAPDLVANGSSIMLTCSARSQPPSDYTWYLNGQQIANSSEYKIDPINSDNQGNYICVAWNFVTGRDSSAIKELTVIELITEVSVNRTPAYPILNYNLSLTCAVSGTVDSRYWLKDGQPLSTDDRIILSGDNSTVSFNPVLLTDNGTYQCTANNPLSNKTSDGYTLVINYGPKQASITGPHLAAVGSSVTLTCSARSQPPCGYTWYFNGTETAQGSHYKMRLVSSANSGPYTCVARNSVTGISSSAVMEFIVIESVSSINMKPTPAYPIENTTFSLTCNVTGAAVSSLWWKDDQPLSTTERIKVSGDNSTVSFNPVLQSDNGTYQCTANNPVSQLTSTGYRLVVNYGPQHVSITGPASAVKGSAVTFTCLAHSQPSCEYTWYFNGNKTANGSQYNISAVSANNNGGYTCVAWNSVTGRNSSAVKKLVVADPNGSVSLASGHAVEVAIAALVLLLCVSG
ncbi:carcinoembryonic antigen-related cell adhesion molecule 5-like isoform X3 [Polyodon spathula]|uniref:carcinoembryonic antigen-related cell adhesion molecule 5-like isoform X3 n=1 Tax=Polyodon spathula TaxID=7913 RepID=UPI001B7EB7A9|nr:carcinoembryonic antigen-related cell adhesion molecule 5-like isoform X3 [Polyodon spathula]